MIQFTKLVTLEANMAVQGNMTLKVNLMVSTGPQQQHPDLLAQIWMPHSHDCPLEAASSGWKLWYGQQAFPLG